MNKKKYKWLVAEEIPAPGYIRKSRYDECIEEFLESGLEAARVAIQNVKPQSLYIMLRIRISKKGLLDRVRVCTQGDKVYLVRLKPS